MLASKVLASRPPSGSKHIARSSAAPSAERVHAAAQKASLLCRASTDDQAASAPAAADAAPPHQTKSRITDILKAPLVKRRGLMMAGAATMFGCACCSDMVAEAQAADWKYTGPAGPTKWPAVCGIGEAQSPVNVVLQPSVSTKGNFPVGQIEFTYGRYENVDILNTGHGTMQVNFKTGNKAYIPPRLIPTSEVSAYQEASDDGSSGGDCLCPSTPFNLDLIQYHFHTPSEHTLDGNQYVMEAHLVHRNKDTGGLAVIAVLMEPGGPTPNPCLQVGLENAPVEEGKPRPSTKSVSPSMLLPPKNADNVMPYIHYTGSLTTPPCSESVDWFVMTTPTKITDKQALDFMYFAGNKKTYAYNNRPTQPLNGRQFEYFEYDI
uniref:Carbonic anhydrase n=1 Tax=Chlamydomonas sp. ICE-L TaxID=309537 RepID=A0A1X9Y2L7_9CHLO|nr:alpha-carbonic anhydrase [Chlamydomonas sp. ICE-L]